MTPNSVRALCYPMHHYSESFNIACERERRVRGSHVPGGLPRHDGSVVVQGARVRWVVLKIAVTKVSAKVSCELEMSIPAVRPFFLPVFSIFTAWVYDTYTPYTLVKQYGITAMHACR